MWAYFGKINYMKIGSIETKNNIFLAPQAGVSEVAFRSLCARLGAGLTYTEMVSVKGLYYNSKNTFELLRRGEEEDLVAVQLFGHEPEIFKKVIESKVLDNFDIIDINMGCPAPKIVKNGDGSALMKDMGLARKIIETCVSVSLKPVTVKFRKGYYKNDDLLVEFAKMCEEAGASAITIHPRTKEDGYSGVIDASDFEKVKRAVKIPVIASGDIVDKESLERVLKADVDGVMLARGAVGHPEIFTTLNGGNASMSHEEIIKTHIYLLKKYYSDERKIVNLLKRHAMKYVSDTKKRKDIALSSSLKEIEEILGVD